MIGQTLSHYKIISKLGAGGFGEVYLAEDSRLDRKVALKILPQHLSERADLRERFEREARAVSSLNHPHICTLYDIGEQDGIHYLVMEHLEGETLAARLEKGALPLEQTLQYAIQIADALDKAHRQGVVHRDLKPGNIMLVKSGAKLLDFGLAKQQATETPTNLSALPTEQASLTAEGTILGTLQYMAPEQLEGKEADRRTDIFAFGAVVYEMATGKKAFEGNSQASLIAKILEVDPQPMSELQPLTPTALDRVVKTCLAKDPDDRWQSARDLYRELKWIAEGTTDASLPTTAAGIPAGSGWSQLLLPVVASVVVAASIASVAVWNLKPAPARPVTRTVVALQADETIQSSAIVPLAFSPDGSQMVYSAQKGDDPPRLYLRPMNSLEDQPLSGTEGANHPFFSPDGQWVGFFAEGELKKGPITGGTVLTICTTSGRTQGASWGTDDRIIFSTIGALRLLQVSADGGTPEVLTSLEGGPLESFLSWPEILPGGKAVLFATGDGTIVVQRLDTGERKVLLQGGTFPHYVSTGHLVYSREGTLMAVLFDPDQLEISGSPVPVIEGIRSPVRAFGGAQLTISKTGALAYVVGSADESEGTLVWVDRQGISEPLAAPLRDYEYPRVSPDGQRIAVGIRERENEVYIGVYDVSRSTLTRLTFESGFNTVPAWSPDGKRLAFTSDREGRLGIFWQMADGSGGVERLTTSDYQTVPASFSPDGQLLAFIEDNPTTGRAIRVLNLEDREAEPFLQNPYEETAPKFSPDGEWMAYSSTESGRREVYVQPYPGPGGKWQISTDGGQEPVWNPQGGELFFRIGDRMMAVELDTRSGFASGTPQMLFEGLYLPTAFSYPFYDVSPDGQRFLMLQPVESQTGGATQINVVLNWFEELKRLVPTP